MGRVVDCGDARVRFINIVDQGFKHENPRTVEDRLQTAESDAAAAGCVYGRRSRHRIKEGVAGFNNGLRRIM